MTLVNQEALLTTVVDRFRSHLGANLYSLIAYGSVVRGNWLPEVSDFNLLLVLEESTPAAHQAIASILAEHPAVNPVIVGRSGFARTFRCFAPKFRSMKRNYRVLHGADCLRQFEIDSVHERFLVEQALRNQRMRCTYAYVTLTADPKSYTRFVVKLKTSALVQISEAMRLAEIEMPKEHAARLPIIQREINADTAVLAELQAIKKEPRVLRRDEIDAIHARLHALLDAVLTWIERRWMLP